MICDQSSDDDGTRCDHMTSFIFTGHIYTHSSTQKSCFKDITKHFTGFMTGCVFILCANKVFQLVWHIRSAHVQLVHDYC